MNADVNAYLGECEPDGDGADDRHSHKDHVEFPTNVFQTDCDGRAVGNGISKERRESQSRSFASKIWTG